MAGSPEDFARLQAELKEEKERRANEQQRMKEKTRETFQKLKDDCNTKMQQEIAKRTGLEAELVEANKLAAAGSAVGLSEGAADAQSEQLASELRAAKFQATQFKAKIGELEGTVSASEKTLQEKMQGIVGKAKEKVAQSEGKCKEIEARAQAAEALATSLLENLAQAEAEAASASSQAAAAGSQEEERAASRDSQARLSEQLEVAEQQLAVERGRGDSHEARHVELERERNEHSSHFQQSASELRESQAATAELREQQEALHAQRSGLLSELHTCSADADAARASQVSESDAVLLAVKSELMLSAEEAVRQKEETREAREALQQQREAFEEELSQQESLAPVSEDAATTGEGHGDRLRSAGEPSDKVRPDFASLPERYQAELQVSKEEVEQLRAGNEEHSSTNSQISEQLEEAKAALQQLRDQGALNEAERDSQQARLTELEAQSAASQSSDFQDQVLVTNEQLEQLQASMAEKIAEAARQDEEHSKTKDELSQKLEALEQELAAQGDRGKEHEAAAHDLRRTSTEHSENLEQRAAELQQTQAALERLQEQGALYDTERQSQQVQFTELETQCAVLRGEAEAASSAQGSELQTQLLAAMDEVERLQASMAEKEAETIQRHEEHSKTSAELGEQLTAAQLELAAEANRGGEHEVMAHDLRRASVEQGASLAERTKEMEQAQTDVLQLQEQQSSLEALEEQKSEGHALRIAELETLHSEKGAELENESVRFQETQKDLSKLELQNAELHSSAEAAGAAQRAEFEAELQASRDVELARVHEATLADAQGQHAQHEAAQAELTRQLEEARQQLAAEATRQDEEHSKTKVELSQRLEVLQLELTSQGDQGKEHEAAADELRRACAQHSENLEQRAAELQHTQASVVHLEEQGALYDTERQTQQVKLTELETHCASLRGDAEAASSAQDSQFQAQVLAANEKVDYLQASMTEKLAESTRQDEEHSKTKVELSQKLQALQQELVSRGDQGREHEAAAHELRKASAEYIENLEQRAAELEQTQATMVRLQEQGALEETERRSQQVQLAELETRCAVLGGEAEAACSAQDSELHAQLLSAKDELERLQASMAVKTAETTQQHEEHSKTNAELGEQLEAAQRELAAEATRGREHEVMAHDLRRASAEQCTSLVERTKEMEQAQMEFQQLQQQQGALEETERRSQQVQLAELETRCAALRGDAEAASSAQDSELHAQLLSAKDEVERLQASMAVKTAETTQQHEEHSKTNAELGEQLEAAQRELATEANRGREHEVVAHDLRRASAEQCTSLVERTKEMEQAQMEFLELQQQQEALSKLEMHAEAKGEEHHSRVQELHRINSEHESNLEFRASELQEAQASLLRHQEQVAAHDAGRIGWQERLTELEAQCSALTANAEQEVAGQHVELETQLIESKEEVARLRSSMAGAEAESTRRHDELQNARAEIVAQLEESRRQIAVVEEKANGHEYRSAELERSRLGTHAELEKRTSELHQKQSSMLQLQEQQAALDAERNFLQDRLSKLEGQNAELEANASLETSSAEQQFEAQLLSAREEVDKLRASVADDDAESKRRHEEHSATHAQLCTKLEVAEQKLAVEMSKSEEHEVRYQDLRKVSVEHSTNLEERTGELQQTHAILLQVQEQRAGLEADCKELQRRTAELEARSAAAIAEAQAGSDSERLLKERDAEISRLNEHLGSNKATQLELESRYSALEAGLELAQQSAVQTDGDLLTERSVSADLRVKLQEFEKKAKDFTATRACADTGDTGGMQDVSERLASRVSELEGQLAVVVQERDSIAARLAVSERQLDLQRQGGYVPPTPPETSLPTVSSDVHHGPYRTSLELETDAPSLQARVRELEARLARSEGTTVALRDAAARATERLNEQAVKERELETRMQALATTDQPAVVSMLSNGLTLASNLGQMTFGRCRVRRNYDEVPLGTPPSTPASAV